AFKTSVSTVYPDWRYALRMTLEETNNRPSWYQAYANGADESKGEHASDYIYDAFVFARIADPDAILYYNDFNETESGKREAIAMMVEELNEQWKNDERNTEPNRLLVEGIGMQAHYWTSDLKASDVETSIRRFAITGALISVTEIDIPLGSHKAYITAPTEEDYLKQADLYKQVFEVYMRHAENIERVTFWGKIDPQSWRAGGNPLLFDKFYDAKPSYFSIMELFDPDNNIPESSNDDDSPPESNVTEETPDEPDNPDNPDDKPVSAEETDDGFPIIPVAIGGGAVLAVGGALIFINKKKA
ncbi:MAG: endo-1,4-beta-xylanase, partial [Oscillospiraceae bacterium]|nr:endo-1,4-beta-xylanase [Oscillospiraceae bacterium]